MSDAYRTTYPRRSSNRRPPRPLPSRGGSARPSQPSFNSAPVPFPSRTANPGVRRLPVKRPMPLWLRSLIALQRGSLVVVFLLAIATLVVYSGTVYTQHLWSSNYRKLKTLQRSEREMTAAEGTMKNYLAKQSERPGAGLITKTPATTIYLETAPKRPENVVPSVAPPSEKQPEKPLGY